MYELRISISGDKIEVAAIKDVLAHFLKLLKMVEHQVASGNGVRWRIATLSYASPVVIGCVGEPKSRKRGAPDFARAIGATLIEGMAALEAGKRPPGFSDDALEISKKLAASRGRRGAKEILVMEANGELPVPLSLTARTVASVEDFIGVNSESVGSVEGRLEVISAHGGITCNVYEALTGKVVRCEVPDEMKSDVLAAFEQRVIASGIVRRDKSGQARQIVLRRLEQIPADSGGYISIAGIAPDFTNGVESAKYLKERWQ